MEREENEKENIKKRGKEKQLTQRGEKGKIVKKRGQEEWRRGNISVREGEREVVSGERKEETRMNISCIVCVVSSCASMWHSTSSMATESY